MMHGLLERFSTMPVPLRIIFLIMLLSPMLGLASILSGSVMHPSQPLFKYGAAKNVEELILVFVATLPAFMSAVLIFMRRRSALLIFPFGYLGVCLGPFFLSVMQEDAEYFMTSLWFSLILGVCGEGYLCFSKRVKYYFEGNSP